MQRELITLKPIAFEDLTLLSKWNFDPEVSLFFPERPEYNEHEQMRWMERNLQAPDKRKYMILHRDFQQAIGTIGFMKIDALNRNAELGITIGEKTLWGSGVALPALYELLNIGFNELNLHLVYAHVFENNLRANRFFDKAGFTTDGFLRDRVYTRGTFISLVIHSITSNEFRRLKN